MVALAFPVNPQINGTRDRLSVQTGHGFIDCISDNSLLRCLAMSRSVVYLLFLILNLSLLTSTARADIRLPRLVSDGMVLQRDARVLVWGWADPGEQIELFFCGQHHETRTDEEGEWRIQLEEMSAGGPFTMVLSGGNRIEIGNVLVGDVWLASGQSNMELPMDRVAPLYGELMAGADYPGIRYFDVPDRYNFREPEEDLEGGEWTVVDSGTIGPVSAVAFFFARDLHRSQEVPVGIINAALGGSPAEAWISEESLKAFPGHYEEAQKFRDTALVERILREDRERIDGWHQLAAERDRGVEDGEILWIRPGVDTGEWSTMNVPGYWPEQESEPVNGVVWFRTGFQVPEGHAGQPADLELGRVVDADITFVNGERVGNTTYQYPPRWYRIPEGLLKAGDNTLTVRVTSEQGRGGFVPDKPYELRLDGHRIDLTGEWRYRIGARMEPLAPQTFIRWKPLGLFNGMIAPLLNTSLSGVIWYQGESNVGAAEEYRELFPAMIADWREQWNRPDLPFLYVQLANYLAASDQPVDSEWARLREAQLETLAVPHTAMAVAIDVGEWNDIHPLDKKTVGERLALAARAGVYGEDLVHSGPAYRSMEVRGERIVLSFDHVNGGLEARGGELREFAIAGADREFVRARAEIRGDRVVVWSNEVAEPVAVRYAWADNPDQANLYNRADLPASPFRTDEWNDRSPVM